MQPEESPPGSPPRARSARRRASPRRTESGPSGDGIQPSVGARGTRSAPAPRPHLPPPVCASRRGGHLRSCPPPRPPLPRARPPTGWRHLGALAAGARACTARRRRAPAATPSPRPRAGRAPGTRASGTAAAPARPTPPSPGARVHPRARAWDSPGPGESCGAAAAALHGDSRSERGARRGGPAGPPQGRLRARGPGWRGRPACRGLEAAARRARRRHGRGASGGQPGAAGEELAVAGLGREVPATSWCSDLHTAPGGRGSDRLAPAQGLGLWCGRRASFEGRET